MAKVLEASEDRFPLSGTRIHKQSGWPDLVAVGPDEIGRLPKVQQKAVEQMVETSQAAVGLVGFLNTGDGSIHFTDGGSPLVATVDKKGGVKKHVQWF